MKKLSARLEFQVQYSSELRSIRVLSKSIILKYNYIPSESHYVILNSRYKRNWIIFQCLAMLHWKLIQVKQVIIEWNKMRKEAVFIFIVGMNLLLYAEAAFGTTTHVNKRDLLGLLENIFDQRKNFLIFIDHSLLWLNNLL